ncbi:MAG: sulfide/dihydroorotate dehydrogenase-like FAD/NAD-binding protein [Campylobacterota bacterium]|nr:sulfide/dihydroorotate dehydrogenase-like FAD/NAD-binding protein [Campylobacterota bacterium]
MYKIVNRKEMAHGTIILNEIEAPQIAKKAKPGQFVMLIIDNKGERVPLTMANVDRERGTITIIYMIVGKSTKSYSELEVGDGYKDIVGPLGEPTHLKKVGTVVCIGGGTGTAVLHPIARGMHEAGNRVITILGARSRDYLIMEKEMKKVSKELKICTDDGSKGKHGFVTEELKELLEKGGVDQVVAIGPVPMMKFVSLMTKEYNVPTLVSLNPIMIDGTGMCGGCRVTIGGKTKFACVDGPEFDGHKVDFDGLMRRLGAYRVEEEHSENCIFDTEDED